MFKLVIQDDEGKMTVVPLIRDEITIGRKEGNTIRLTERNVSRRHARILRNNGEVHIEDLGSYNGIRVNNARIAERVSLRVSDQVQIGDYKLYLKAEGLEQADEGHTMPLERVDSQIPTDAMAAVPAPGGTAPHGIPTPPPQMIGNPNRTMVAISDTDPTQRTIGPATAAAVAAMTATGGYGRLVVVSSNFAGKEFELSRPQMIIGRTDENDIVIAHRSISRNHAKLVREPETGRYTISDLQSSNGVRVNGQDYGKVELRRGDVVDLGHVRLRFIEAGEDFVFARDAVITDVPEAGSRRGLLVALLATVVVLVAGVVMYSMHGSEKPPDETSTPGPGSTSGSFMGSNDQAVATAPSEPVADAVAPGTTAGTPAAATNTPGTNAAKAEDVKTKLGECTELVTQKRWQPLDDCAAELEVLGAKDKSSEFHEKAKRETQNDKRNDEITRALGVGNLRLAQTTLKQMGEDSVYYKAQHDAFLRAEAPVIEQTKRQAQAYVKSHDCQALRRYAQQQRDSSTTAVAAAANGQVPLCTPPQAAVAIDRPPPANPTTNPATTVATPPPPPPPPPPASNACATMNVEDAMSQAANQYSAGYAKAALALVVKALQCKQEIRMYRMAAMYACGARDLQTAKTYFFKLPTNLQSGIEQKCQQENLNLRGPPP